MNKYKEALEEFCVEYCQDAYRYDGNGECVVLKAGNCKPRETMQELIDKYLVERVKDE